MRHSGGYTNTPTQADRKTDAQTDISREDKYRSRIPSRWRLTGFDMNPQMTLALQDSAHLSAAARPGHHRLTWRDEKEDPGLLRGGYRWVTSHHQSYPIFSMDEQKIGEQINNKCFRMEMKRFCCCWWAHSVLSGWSGWEFLISEHLNERVFVKSSFTTSV